MAKRLTAGEERLAQLHQELEEARSRITAAQWARCQRNRAEAQEKARRRGRGEGLTAAQRRHIAQQRERALLRREVRLGGG